MTKVDGSRLIMMIEADGKRSAIAYATELEMTLEANVLKTAPTEDGGWDNHKKKDFSWRMSINHLLSMVRQRVQIEQLIESAEVVGVLIAIVPPGGFDPMDVVPEQVMVRGSVMFKRMTITGQQGGFAVMSVELLGDDELLEA